MVSKVQIRFKGPAWQRKDGVLKSFLKGGLTIFKILLIVAIIAAVWCIFAAIVCLVAASREIELPDIEDIEVVE